MVEFLGGAILALDCEDPVAISAFQIRQRTINFRKAPAGQRQFDHALRERMALRLVVIDEQGHELGAKALREIPLGFDTELQAGEFYESPRLGFFYWLERIDGDRIHWVMLESFQHGNLMQAEIVQQGLAAIRYVKVEDEITRRRFQRRLIQYQAISAQGARGRAP